MGRVGLVERLDRSERSLWYPRAGGGGEPLRTSTSRRSTDFSDGPSHGSLVPP